MAVRAQRRGIGWELGLAWAALATAACGGSDAPSALASRCVSPDAGRPSLIALGDTGQPRRPTGWFDPQLAVAAALDAEHRSHPVAALVLLGDNFYPAGVSPDDVVERVAENVVEPYCRFLDLSRARSSEVAGACTVPEAERTPVPLVAVLGNHDYTSAQGPELERRVLPQLVASWRMASGLADVEELAGGLSIIHFDSVALYERENADPLRDAIARSRGPWRILAAHHPLLGEGWNRDHRYREHVLGAIRDAGVAVHVFLAGHEHNLQAAVSPAPGLPLLVVAGSGAGARASRLDVLGRSFERVLPGFARIDLDAGGLVVSLISTARVPLERWREPRIEACYRIAADGRVTVPAPVSRSEPGRDTS